MVAFAEVSDLEARWRPLEVAEQSQATVLLDDASTIIRAECPDADTLDSAITLMVACGMVKRAMSVPAGMEGVTSLQQSAGPFQQTPQFSNPMGNLYLTKQDRKLLGISGQAAFMVDQGPYEDFDSRPLNWWELNL